jgi:hypothetical protein
MAGSSIGLAQVLAHQGGWDEMLLVAVPIVVIVALLALAKRRVDDAAADRVADATSPDATSAAAGQDEPGRIRDGR